MRGLLRGRAIADFAQAKRIDPHFALAHVGRGLAYRDKQECILAISDYDRALRFSHKDQLAPKNKALAEKELAKARMT